MSLLANIAGWKGYALVALASALVASGGTWKLRDMMAADAALQASKLETKAAEHVVARVVKSDAASNAAGVRLETKLVATRTVYRNLIVKVPFYVTRESDRTVIVPAGFVRLHDLAAQGADASAAPDPTPGAADAPSGIALSTVGATVTDNYGACRENAERLKAWQSWWAEQVRLWNEK